MRALRPYRSIAMVRHWCDNCCADIFPGSEYEAIVYVTKQRRIIVHKRHVNPACDWPEDPVSEDRVPVLRYAFRAFCRAA